MANELLKPGGVTPPHNQEVKTMAKKTDQEKVSRKWLYSPDCPEGRIFEGADAIADAEEDGWVDTPAKLKSDNGGKGKAANGNNRKKSN
jgi:hypothetical protein